MLKSSKITVLIHLIIHFRSLRNASSTNNSHNATPTPESVQIKENSTRSNSETTQESEEIRTHFIDGAENGEIMSPKKNLVDNNLELSNRFEGKGVNSVDVGQMESNDESDENADIVPPKEDVVENNVEMSNGFKETKVNSMNVGQLQPYDEAINSKGFFHNVPNNKQGKSIDQKDPNKPKLMLNGLLTPNIPSSEKNSSFFPRSPTEETRNKSVAKDQTRGKTDPTSTHNINRIKLTTANEEDDLQYITVYYRQDDEKKAAEEIHRKLESIINNTNTDLISILQSYGFTGDPYSFEAPTTPIPYNSQNDDHPKISTSISAKNKDSSQNQDDYVNSDSSLIVQGKVLRRPLNDLQREEETTDTSSQVSFKIFTYNKTKNFLETHTDGDNNQVQKEKMHETDIIQSQNRNKKIHQNRFVPRRFDEIPKAGIVDIKVYSFCRVLKLSSNKTYIAL